MNLKRLNILDSAVVDVLLLFLAFSLSLFTKKILAILPSPNYQGVINSSTSAATEVNYIAFLFIITSTIALFLGFRYLRSKPTLFFRPSLIVVFVLALLCGVFAPTIASRAGNIDTFHAGEQLSPAFAYLEGKSVYKDIFVLRGAGEDVLMPVVSFKLFGQSIGSYYLLSVLLQILSAVAFFILLSKLIRSDALFIFSSIWFVSSSYSNFYAFRDIFVWLFILSIIYALRKAHQNKYILFVIGFLPIVTVFISMDRGFFLLAMLLVVLLFILATRQIRGGVYVFTSKDLVSRLINLWPVATGIIAANIVAVLILGYTSYIAFFSHARLASKFQGLIFNTPYPPFSLNTLSEWLPVLVASFTVLAVCYQLAMSRRISRELAILILMTLFGIIFFRGATGRPDLGHISYGSTVLFLAFALLLQYWASEMSSGSAPDTKPLQIRKETLLICASLLCIASLHPKVFYIFRIAEMLQSPIGNVKLLLDAPRKPDSFWLGKAVENNTLHITSVAKNASSLFVFSSDPIYYYSTGLTNPTKYYISWFADASPLEFTLLSELRKNPPDVVLYKSGTYYDRPEFVSMQDRLPLVNSWILKNYHQSTESSAPSEEITVLTKNK